jgi:hypothetical protein
MNAMNLLLSVLLQLLPAVQVTDGPPGTAFAKPAAGTVLRAGPGADFPGAFTLDGSTVVRVGELRGTYRQVFVPQGFGVYMHTDYLDLSPADATLMVRGDRVNMRLLPSSEGLLPIAQCAAGTGPLVLLGQEHEWVRVLAPLATPLFAPDELLPAATDAAAAETWAMLHAQREQQRQAAMAGWRATDKEYQREAALLDEVEHLADTDLASLDASARSARRARLGELWAAAKWDRTRSIIGDLRGDLDAAEKLADAGSRATDQVRDQARSQPAPAATDTPELATLKKESRMLALGFRFRGKGDAVTRSGSVHKEGVDGAPVYTLHGKDGEILKLTAPSEVATLEALVGKQVELGGRRLFLTTVDGPVLVVDKVVSYRPR